MDNRHLLLLLLLVVCGNIVNAANATARSCRTNLNQTHHDFLAFYTPFLALFFLLLVVRCAVEAAGHCGAEAMSVKCAARCNDFAAST